MPKTGPQSQPGKRRDRTFTGCWTCRSRRVKCDGRRPICNACTRLGFECMGYGTRLVWVDSENAPYKSDGRRLLRCDLTWKNTPVLDSNFVDYLISACDDDGYEAPLSNIWNLKLTSPFGVFEIKSPSRISDSSAIRPISSWSICKNPSMLTNLTEDETLLFHHYTSYVAQLMMPFEHPRNPWRIHYPAVALHNMSSGQKALYHALLAHAAFNMKHLGKEEDKMAALAHKYYNLAIPQVMDSIQSQGKEYGDTIAAIMTLMMVEIYSGRSTKWKYHLTGAWAYLLQSQRVKPWIESDFACCSTQSLYIIKIISSTCATADEAQDSFTTDGIGTTDAELLSSISSTFEFGFTIGATKGLLECISSITAICNQASSGKIQDTLDETVARVLAQLDACQKEVQSTTAHSLSDQMAGYQVNAFISAIYIYLYRTFFDLPPWKVATYVRGTFDNVSKFFEHDGGSNLSLWPAFIAAVEAYTADDLTAARAWLQRSTSFGLGNRPPVKAVVEEVWRRREAAAENLGTDIGFVSVDWREVMKDLEIDVLLI